jgi:hypothetical protein
MRSQKVNPLSASGGSKASRLKCGCHLIARDARVVAKSSVHVSKFTAQPKTGSLQNGTSHPDCRRVAFGSCPCGQP